MYYRDPGHIDLERLAKDVRAKPVSKPLRLSSRLLLSIGMIVAPVAAFLLVLGIAGLGGGL